MGNVNGYKRVLSIALAVICMLVFSFSMTFAAKKSPTEGTVSYKSSPVTGIMQYTHHKNGTASADKIVRHKKTAKISSIPASITVEGVKYKVTVLKKNAYKGTKKIKVIKIKSRNLKTIKKGAFNGLSKKVVVKISKKNFTKKQFKAMAKKVRKAGFKGKIKWAN